MLPGMGALRSEYRLLAPHLQDAGYHPVTVDLRGLDESSVPWPRYDVPAVGQDIIALIEYLNAGAAHVMATSFSPGPAVWAAAERPDAIRSLTLIGAFVRDAQMGTFMKVATWLMMNNPWRVKTWLKFYRTLYPSQKQDDFDAYLDQLRANLSEPGCFEASKALSGSSRRPSEEGLSRVEAPVLVVMGTKDPDFPDPAAEAEQIAAQSGMVVAVLVGVGRDAVGIGGSVVGGGTVRVCVGAQAATIATRITAPIRVKNPAIFKVIELGA